MRICVVIDRISAMWIIIPGATCRFSEDMFLVMGMIGSTQK